MKSKKGIVMTITSMKGGVGKTTTTMMLASIYENFGNKVLVIDLDLYNGNLAFAYKADYKNTIYNLCDDFANNRLKDGINNDYVVSVSNNIFLLAAPKDPRQANKINNKALNTILHSLIYSYDVILIDTNHTLDITNMIAFENSDRIINIITNDSFDLQKTKSFVAICENMEVDNLVIMLNNSINPSHNYFSLYDIKNIIKRNVDYTIPNSLYLRNFDQLVMDGKLGNFYDNMKLEARKKFDELAVHMVKLIEKRGDDNNEKD